MPQPRCDTFVLPLGLGLLGMALASRYVDTVMGVSNPLIRLADTHAIAWSCLGTTLKPRHFESLLFRLPAAAQSRLHLHPIGKNLSDSYRSLQPTLRGKPTPR